MGEHQPAVRSSSTQVLFEAGVTESTRRTLSAAFAGDAVIASHCILVNIFEKSEPIGKRPFVRLRLAHERRDDDDRIFERQTDGLLLCANEDSTTVGIAGVVSLRDAGVDICRAQRLGPDRGDLQENRIAALNDGIGN